MGAICCHAARVPIQSAQKPYAAFPRLIMLNMKLDQNWPSEVRDILF